MIESLKYVVTFNTTGRTLKNQLNFKPGITVIKGENEAGKSFVLEMIRYALFGSDALRGPRTGYEKLEVELVIYIKGKKYKIVRKGNKATVNIDEAVGTKATNNHIKKVLGYGLDVFDISGHAMQGELDKLTKDMGPTERRKIIDDVTGLSQYQKAEKECREQANEFRKIAEALEAQLVEPELPAKPDSYEESSVLKVRLDEEIRNKALRDSFEEMAEPQEPQKPSGSDDSIEHEKERESWWRQKHSLTQKLEKLPEIDDEYSQAELEGFKLSIEQDERGPQPEGHSGEDLSKWLNDWAILARESEPLRCPECDAIVSGKPLPSTPPLTVAEIEQEQRRARAWEGHTYNDGLKPSPLSRADVDSRLAAYAAQPQRAILEQQLAELGSEPQDRSEEAKAWQEYEQALSRYADQKHAYGNYLMNKNFIEELPEPEPYLQELYDMAVRYETLMSKYETTKDIYDAQAERMQAAKEKQQGYKRGSEAIKDARKEVKRYLVPSLNKVASHLLTEMTDGERRTIKINEDFDIWVDNQPVQTLSGSGVSVVNLALRVALGQVLTQSVVPIFLADEIDANMGAKRTKATHDSLKRLRKKLKQIIVVTHKEFEGDHSVCLN